MPFKYRILYVEDEAPLREVAKAILEAKGYEVLCAEDGLQGIAALEDSLPDLIISDLQMPNVNGYKFLAIVRQRFPQLPVIVISGKVIGDRVPNGVMADAVFEKSQYTQDQLLATIAALVRQSPVRPPLKKPSTRVRMPHRENEDIA